MSVKGGRLEFLVPHLLRGQLLRPGFVRMSLRLGVARQMPAWAKLQFLHAGVSPRDLDRVLGRITSLASWVDEWEKLGHIHETRGREAIETARPTDAIRELLAASAAYNFAQYVVFLDIARKRVLHEACVRAYAACAPLMDPPATPFDVPFRRRTMKGYLRVPYGPRLAPVVVLVNGTNAVKEEMHWWSEAFLERGIATIMFDGPGLGETFHRLSMVAEPRPVGRAILDHIETHPELDPNAVAFVGLSLGGYLALRMAAHDRRIRAVGAVSPPYSADIYWNVTLAGMRRELAALYNTTEREMEATIHRITLADAIAGVKTPFMVTGGGQDHITPGAEAWRIFEHATCERELLFYPRGGHECFNVLSDLRPRMVSWITHQLEQYHSEAPVSAAQPVEPEGTWGAAEAVDPDFADALSGEMTRRVWNRAEVRSEPVRWSWLRRPGLARIEVVQKRAAGPIGTALPAPPVTPRLARGAVTG